MLTLWWQWEGETDRRDRRRKRNGTLSEWLSLTKLEIFRQCSMAEGKLEKLVSKQVKLENR